MVVFDTSLLLFTVDPTTRPPRIPGTEQPLLNCPGRVSLLLTELAARGARVMVPTPVLSEFMIKAGPNRDTFLAEMKRSRAFQISPFDEACAMELALLEDADLKSVKPLSDEVTKAKLKFDRQIVAMAKVHRVTAIYTGDVHLSKVAKRNGIHAMMTWELPEPPPKPQGNLDLDEPPQPHTPR